MRLKQHALTAATLVLIGGAAVGCGGNNDSSATSDPTSSSPSGSPSASSDASSAAPDASSDFCTGLTSTGQISNGKDVVAFVDTLQSLSLPDDAPAEASDGFAVYIKALGTVDASATPAQLKKMGDLGLSTADKTKVQSFLQYAAQACAPAASSTTPSPTPSQ